VAGTLAQEDMGC